MSFFWLAFPAIRSNSSVRPCAGLRVGPVGFPLLSGPGNPRLVHRAVFSYREFCFFAALEQTMKNRICFLLLLSGILSLAATAQDCTYFKQGKDNNTGEPFRESRQGLLKNIAFQLRKEGTTKLSCFLDITLIGSLTYTIRPQDTLYLKLENYQMIKLVPDKEYAPKKVANMNGMVSKYLPYFKISPEILEKLAASPIVQVRISFDKPIEGAPKKPDADGILKAAGCMLKD
jgi:hypothetical protein